MNWWPSSLKGKSLNLEEFQVDVCVCIRKSCYDNFEKRHVSTKRNLFSRVLTKFKIWWWKKNPNDSLLLSNQKFWLEMKKRLALTRSNVRGFDFRELITSGFGQMTTFDNDHRGSISLRLFRKLS